MSWSVPKSEKQDETLFASGTDQIVDSSNHNNDSNVKETSQNTFLHPPITGPVRPLSPDTISNLSVEEYDQLRSEHFPVNDSISLSAEKPTSFRQKSGIQIVASVYIHLDILMGVPPYTAPADMCGDL